MNILCTLRLGIIYIIKLYVKTKNLKAKTKGF